MNTRELWRVISLIKQLIKNMEDGNIHGRTVEEMVQTTKYIVEISDSAYRKIRYSFRWLLGCLRLMNISNTPMNFN